jgi:hypothetical protein
MSSLHDYSKWANIEDSDDDDEQANIAERMAMAASQRQQMVEAAKQEEKRKPQRKMGKAGAPVDRPVDEAVAARPSWLRVGAMVLVGGTTATVTRFFLGGDVGVKRQDGTSETRVKVGAVRHMRDGYKFAKAADDDDDAAPVIEDVTASRGGVNSLANQGSFADWMGKKEKAPKNLPKKGLSDLLSGKKSAEVTLGENSLGIGGSGSGRPSGTKTQAAAIPGYGGSAQAGGGSGANNSAGSPFDLSGTIKPEEAPKPISADEAAAMERRSKAIKSKANVHPGQETGDERWARFDMNKAMADGSDFVNEDGMLYVVSNTGKTFKEAEVEREEAAAAKAAAAAKKAAAAALLVGTVDELEGRLRAAL